MKMPLKMKVVCNMVAILFLLHHPIDNDSPYIYYLNLYLLNFSSEIWELYLQFM